MATGEGTPIIAGTVALGMTGIYLALEKFGKKHTEQKPEHAEAAHDSAEEK